MDKKPQFSDHIKSQQKTEHEHNSWDALYLFRHEVENMELKKKPQTEHLAYVTEMTICRTQIKP